ncbi:rdgB/HAM1 family non-canonical purine NTP pyrophosphatase [Bacillus smithii 7_3_47FAA]|uniref:dITP/XTP pyrophosphatase n=2 Tax=Bacillus smithii TaxID=1479 RepID=G9QQ91_9BACI|nr:rdgB/HAM1 family non-canonical purine NTP pyrophosphatase [Bacillus smithii 7_3_47FAA]
MMREVVIATKNKGKALEFEQMFQPFQIQVKTLLDLPEFPEIEETGATFEENAIIKAESVMKETKAMVMADDSGLVIDALDGRPGVYSARYAGPEKDDEANIQKVLRELEGVPLSKRTARFYCALALAIPGRETITVNGTCEGFITFEKKGANGFGYDPIFFVQGYGRTMAELLPNEKNKISHRAEALAKMRTILEQLERESVL